MAPQGLTKDLDLFLAPAACSGFPGELILPCRVLGAAPCRPRRLVASGAPDERNHPKMKIQKEKEKKKKNLQKKRGMQSSPVLTPSAPCLPCRGRTLCISDSSGLSS